MQYKRRVAIAVILALLLATLTACGSTEDNKRTDSRNFSVDFIDVGLGDAIYVAFPNGDDMLVDCGNGSEINNQKVKKTLDERGVRDIEYFVISHPDIAHHGGTQFILDNYSVKTAYLPDISLKENFPSFNRAYESIDQKANEIKYFSSHMEIGSNSGEYLVKFLSPKSKDLSDSSYNDIDFINPTDEQMDDVSAVIYIESQKNRLLLTGDAGSKIETEILNSYKVGVYGDKVNLRDIDVLKVSSHGSDRANSYEFLSLLNPKSAVFSVGGDNEDNLPSTVVIERLITINENCKILRTDHLGSISFAVKDGEMQITSD